MADFGSPGFKLWQNIQNCRHTNSDIQGWISDRGIDDPTVVPKKWLMLTYLGQRLSEKVGFFLIFEPIL